MQQGYLDLKNNEVEFIDNRFVDSGETETSRVRATGALWNEGRGTGRLKATRTNPTGNVAGLGLTFTPSVNMGSTVIYRGHNNQTGANLTTSIFRYYELQPTTYATLNINPFSYFDAELNGITPESDLKIMQLYNSSNYWQLRPTTLNTTTNQAVGSTGANSLSYIKVTLAKSPCSLTASAGSNSPICAGSTINLTSNATNGYGTLTYNWSGPNSFSSTLQNPTISNASVASSGTYYVTITDELNCTAVASVVVTVNALPNVTVSASPSTICSGSSSTLTASGATSYSWSGGLGTGNPKVVSPTTTTSYTVTGTDANGCSNTASVTVTVNALPNITVSSNSPVCGNDIITLNATGGVAYTWTGPNGFTSIEQNPTITNANGSNAGTYYVTVTDGNNCTATGQTEVVVHSIPELTVTSNSPLCTGQDLQLTSSNAVSWQWSGPNGWTSNVQNPVITNAQTSHSGTYSVTITDANGCTNNSSVNVTVNETPLVNAGVDQTIPYGTSTTLTGSASGGSGNYSFNWTPEDSLINATVQNPTTVNLENTTTFVLMVTDVVSGCKGYDTVVVYVQGGPLHVVVSVNDNEICSGESIQLQATASGGSGNYTYNWSSNPSGFTSNISNPTDNPVQSTIYYVTVSDGNTSTIGSVQVTVHSLPVVEAHATSTEICEGSQVTLYGSGANSYVWNNGVTNNVPFVPTTTQTYTVTGTDANGCTATDQITITVHSLPVVEAHATSTEICEGSQVTLYGSGANSYVWNNGVTNNVPFVPTTTQTYTVTGTDANGCTATDQITITVNQKYVFAETHTICDGSSYTWHGNTYNSKWYILR